MLKKRNRHGKYSNRRANLTKNVILHVTRLLFGAVFIFSGFVKAIDPLGSTYKIQDYFHEFGGVFTSMTDWAFGLSVAQSAIELLIGLNLVFMVHLRRTAYLGLLFMLVMTPLTLYIALFNPVSDCGCFGDALVITNWQTFWKNIVLLILIIGLLVVSKNKRSLFLPHVEWILVLVFLGVGVGLSVYSYRHLPLIDFLPYKVGVNIPEAMEIPDGAAADVYTTTFVYEKNGVQKEFTLENYPKGDATWTFVDQKSKLVSKGYVPAIHDFTIVSDRFEDITAKVLSNTAQSYLLVMYDVNKTSVDGAKRAEEIYLKYKNSVTQFYALTASSDEDIAKFRKTTGVTFPFCKTDPTTLKTIIRANPGLVLIQNGTIQGKWNWRDF
jgi:uncharacterized membrane protein YphA (DoxX/SURF4 family)